MSRVTYTNTLATPDQEKLRDVHQVRLVNEAEEGTGVNALPDGVYGFTYSPALPSAPLFRTRHFRSFETHKLASGEVLIVAFASAEDARQIASTTGDVSIRLQPEPEAGMDVLVAIPYSRIRQHRQYTVHTEHGITLTLMPQVAT